MKKIDKKGIIKLIILLVLLITQIKAFNNSRANKITYVTAQIIDSSGLLSDETSSIVAINEGDNGMAITLPDILNTKRVTKYIVTKKEIIDTELEEDSIDSETEEEISTSTEITTVDMTPGEKLYLTQNEIENLEIELTVEYDTIEVDSQILYNKKLTVTDADSYELLSVSGYMPYNTEIETSDIDISNLENKLLEKYSGGFLIGNYNISLISDEIEYIAKNYNQTLNIEIAISDGSKIHYVVEVQDNDIKEIENIEIKEGKIKFSVEELKTYLVLEMQGDFSTYVNEEESDEDASITNSTAISVDGNNAKFTIDDYESDKNYYLGLNYTEEMSKENTGKYTESNLKEVTVNYYGYDYSLTEFIEPKEYDITLSATASRTTSGTVTSSNSGGGGGPNNRTYTKTDTITCTISGINELKQQYSNYSSDSSWIMEIAVPSSNFSNYFDSASCSTDGVSVNVANSVITITGSDMTDIMNSTNDTWSFTFTVTFKSTNRNSLNNISYTTLTVNSCKATIIMGDYTPYATISDTELKTLVSYRKCVPVDSSGKVSIELIDNPFMNRPLKRGFNGWKTNNSKYANSITTNSNTYEQTLSTNISNITESDGSYVINLYPDWVEANVVFVSSSGSSSNSGTSPSSPIDNTWTNINTKINSNKKTCTNASSREVNIIVLMNGSLDISGLTGPSTPYTLTSLYGGTNYGSSSTYLKVESTDVYLDSDLQLDYIYINTSQSYASPGDIKTDGTSAVTPCIYGNMYNLRIGRGVTPTSSGYCTFAQVQGGYYNRSGSEYKLIIESGQYYTIQLYRASSSVSTNTTANAKMIIGCDIDRKDNNNDNLKIYNRMASRTSSGTCSPYGTNGIVAKINIKSGTIGVDFFNSQGDADSNDRNYAGVYIGGHGSTSGYDYSDRYLLIEGGNIANVIGGLKISEDDLYKTYMYIKGGNMFNITGGAGYTHTYGDRIIQVTGGCVKYSISGGSNGVAASSDRDNGQLTGTSLIYVGGDAHIGASYTLDQNGSKVITETSSSEVLYGVNAGSVCGGANGNSSYAGQTDGSYIIIDGNAVVHNNVFGGGNYGIIGASSTDSESPVIELKNETSNFQTNTEYLITTSTSGGNGLSVSGTSLADETISTASIPSDSAKWIFENNGGNQYYIKNSSTNQYIYISRTSNSWNGTTATVTLSTTNKTAFNVSGTNSKNITYTSGSTTLYLKYSYGWTIASNSNWSGSSNNSLYLLTYEKLPEEEIENQETLVNIKVYGGNVKNNIYGGANQNNIYGTVDIDIENGIVNGIVYGGSNIKGNIFGSVLMDITGGQLGLSTNTDSDVAFGGGLGSETNVKGRVLININETKNNLNIYGNVYGGSSLGSISSNIEINVQDIPATANILSINGNIFGGGKGNNSTSAIVTGNITVNVDGSNLSECTVFGGCNINGTISGTIIVNVGKTYETILNSVYGGGNQANIGTETQSVNVYLLGKADVTNAFNGGKSADLISSGIEDTTRGIYLQGGKVVNLYGGSDSSGTVTVSNVHVESGRATNVYGGNNQGGITEVTNVLIKGGILENVYGGGEKAETGTSNITITDGTANYIFGGGNQAGATTTNIETKGGNIGTIFGGANVSGDVSQSYVTTNDASSSGQTSGVTMNVTYTASEAQSWQSTTYPTVANITVKFTNNTENAITTWNASIFAPNSTLFSNYSNSEIIVNDGVYSLTEQNRYYGTNTISAGGSYTLDFTILSMESVEGFTVGYSIQGQDSNGNSVSDTKSLIGTVYGGNNQGGTTQTTNLTINGGGVNNVYGGGNQAVTNETNVNVNGEVSKNIFGGGNQAGVNTNTNVTLIGATVGDNVYGGGNQGTVTQNTYVHVRNSILKNSLYAGGNGVSAIVYGNVNLTMEGTNQVIKNVFGGGNQAATGTEVTNNSVSTVNIVGGTIGGNVYGGANTSVVYGTTQTNIGYDAVGDTLLEIGDIHIEGTVFGGGEANASGSEIYDFDFISVTVGIDIQINGSKHTNFAILGSIFGSGNASSTSGTSYITLKNYGTPDNPQSNVSLQRADCATIINSALSLSGATDRTNEYSAEFFSISRVDEVKLKNNSILYLCNNANLLKTLRSVVDINGEEVKGEVTIDDETGETTRNVDNRIYMLETKNLNVALNEKATIYGQVQGMFFFGLFTNRNNPATSTGLYHNGYNNGDEITNAGTFVANSYVKAEHLTNPEHDITVDGFYTNYDEEGIIKTNYIKPTPDADIYYMWIVGKALDVTTFEVPLIASKYATMGTAEQSLDGFSEPNIKFSIIGFSAGLANGISLVDPSLIENIQLDEETANTQFGLAMKTGNMGWQTKGKTTFYTDDGGKYAGTTNYSSDNSTYTPTLNFYFYNSQNLSKKQTLGEVKIRLQAIIPIDDLNDKISIIDINLTLTTNLFPGDAYEAAITPGQQFELFTSTDTTITSNSAFSVYYSLLIQDFSTIDEYKEFETFNRVLVSRDVDNLPYTFPLNTKITMLDMATDKYYYYIVTEDDITNGKYIYALEDFIEMGSSNSKLDETQLFERCHNSNQDLVYENYIFHVNFVDSNLEEDIVQNSLLMELRSEDNQTILGVLGIQRENIVYTVYRNKSATIKVDSTIEPETIYLGNPINLDVTTSFTQALLGSKTIYDTQYFDKKLGIKISIYDSNGNRLNNDSLFGINFELDGQYYYPRIDGTTRICIADKVTDVLARIRINTENNTTLASGDYTIKIESFGSSDGIYYGLVASDEVEVNIKIINFAYGLKVTTSDKTKIVDYKTGFTQNGSNSLVVNLEYSSSLSNPNIALSLYRRDYSEVVSQNYNLVDLQDYIKTKLNSTSREKEYEVSTNPQDSVTYFLYLKDNLVTGTYKLVYKLYDNDTYVGEAYEYLIIK